jgi:two-component system nitrogen regulation response regulator GlnG
MADVARILVVEDDAAVAWTVEQALTGAGYAVQVAADAAAARRLLKRSRPDLVLTDIRMPGESGLDLAAALRSELPGTPVIVTTAHGTMDTAVAAVGAGAFDYLPKPMDLGRLLAVVRRALGDAGLAAAAQPGPAIADTIVGATAPMQEVYRRLAAAAPVDVEVLITGAPGTGKEAIARALHLHSRRADKPFIAVDCGGINEDGQERELFGADGTGGRIVDAHGGSLLLSEIDALAPAAQARLMRWLESPRAEGDPRLLAATSHDLVRLAASGAFREDLSWRLRSLTIAVPALVDRLDDLPALVRHLLSRQARRLGRAVAVTEAALDRLRRHAWPGNVRELRHVVDEAAVLATGGVIDVEHLDLPPDAAGEGPAPGGLSASLTALAQRLCNSHPGEVQARFTDACEEHLLRTAIARTEGNQLRAAELLGINRITLKKRMDQLGVTGKG